MAQPTTSVDNPRKTECAKCPLRKLDRFRDFDARELDFVSKFKRGELTAEAGSTILVEGTNSPHLYTIRGGWGFRYKMLPDGRRQVLNYVMPGDFIGLQGSILEEMQHTVEALSNMELCVFERERFADLYQNTPSLAYDLTWIAAREEQILDEHLLSVGRRTALERSAYLIAYLYERASQLALFDDISVITPLTQQHIADSLGLSLVHTNKTLKKLSDRKLIRWVDNGCQVMDVDALKNIAEWEGLDEVQRPFI